ncbi:von Willebrand factor type D domain-containing protein [Micromonospora viridifaciens]|uniref:von Willebrand factor type D domain-containing protein n=1 Tax=Micromonospora viridifaciens TaxID=1881 RepID=A0A1C4UYL9_MICVI|nr:VWD domain-containing protein [Micromonospora viridifaciens]SCE76745.1 von Willebrand factor type D domain-containing protein [Micromonospora viridifaciens]
MDDVSWQLRVVGEGRRAALRILALLVCSGLAFIGTPGTALATSQVSLQGSASKAEYTRGERVQLTFTVTNPAAQECQVGTAGDGSLIITGVSRDGKALTPQIAPVSYIDGLATLMLSQLAPVNPGARATIDIDSGERAALRSASWSAASGSVLALWQVDQPGDYRVTAVYSFPRLPEQPTDVCNGSSQPIMVSFAILDDKGSGSKLLLWLIISVALAVVLVAAVLTLRRVRRIPPAAVLLVLAVVPTAAVVVAPAPAYAEIVFDNPGDGALQAAYGECVRKFRAEDGAGDPAGIFTQLEFSPHRIVIARQPHRQKNPIGSFATPDDWRDATNGTGTGSRIDWDPLYHGYPQAGTTADSCAGLYHEMYHAYEFSKGIQDSSNCRATDKGPDAPQAAVREIAATLAENAYRRYHGLTPRDSYNGLKLPNSIDDCYQQNRPRPPRKYPVNPGRAGGDCPAAGCADSNGDPHLTTFDGLHYDLQAAGEFVAVIGSGLEVQTRQVPYPGSTTVSVNSAVAMNIDGDRVAFYQTGDGIEVRVAGEMKKISAEALVLPHGGTIARTPEMDAYLVVWPDSSSAWVAELGTWGLNLDVRLADVRKNAVSGIFGNFDGSADNDLVSRDGKTVDTAPDFDTLYRKFGHSWRVRDGESLFDYPSGQNTHTFTLADFPSRPVSAADLTARDVAELICRNAGVFEQPYLDDCIVDVAVTGQSAFVAGMAATQAAATGVKVGAGQNSAPSQTPVPSGHGPLRDGSTVADRITAAVEAKRFDLDLGDTEVFYIADWHGTTDGCDQTFSVNLVGVSHSNFPCTNGIVEFTIPDVSRRYQLEIASASTGTGPFSFTLITAKPHTAPAALGATITGRIQSRGQEDAYELSAGVSAVTLTKTSGCDADIFAEVHDLTADSVLVGSNPLCGNRLGPYPLPDPTHRYAVVIRSIFLKTGRYAFTLG